MIITIIVVTFNTPYLLHIACVDLFPSLFSFRSDSCTININFAGQLVFYAQCN